MVLMLKKGVVGQHRPLNRVEAKLRCRAENKTCNWDIQRCVMVVARDGIGPSKDLVVASEKPTSHYLLIPAKSGRLNICRTAG
jgi:hypothetical protein